MAVSQDSAQLLVRIRGGDAEALRVLLERCGGQVWREIERDLGARYRSLVDADDVMQVTYLEAFLQAGSVAAEDEAGFVAWLRRVARNNLQDAIKELNRQKRPSPARKVEPPNLEDSCTELVALLGMTTTTPSRLAGRDENRQLLQRALDQMPSDYAEVVRRYDLEGHDVDAVAAALGRSRGAVHMLRARAHDRLRTLLGAPSSFLTR